MNQLWRRMSTLGLAAFLLAACGGAPQAATANIASVIQTVLAAQLVTRGGILDGASPPASNSSGSAPVTAPALPPVPPGQTTRR